MPQVKPKPDGRQPVPDLVDLESLKAYQTLRDALQGFEAVVMENFFARDADDHKAFVTDLLEGLYQFRDKFSLLDCGNQCPKGRACVPCATAIVSHQ